MMIEIIKPYIDPITKKEYSLYTAEYNFEGSRWGIEIWATSEEEAEERIKRLAFARYSGKTMMNIHVGSGKPASLLQKVIKFVQDQRKRVWSIDR